MADFINWGERCKEKDRRIKELEGKFDLIVERLEESERYSCSPQFSKAIDRAIEIVNEVGGS